MKPVLFILFSIYSYTLFSTEVENDNSVVIEISELNDALESSSDSADENLCTICYDDPLDPELICKTCHKKMACLSCMKSIVQSQSTVVEWHETEIKQTLGELIYLIKQAEQII